MKLSFIYPKNRLHLGLTIPTAAYEKIWNDDAERIEQTFTHYTRLHFQQKQIEVKVHDDISVSGTLKKPLHLNVRNDTLNLKRFALIHELGHRLLSGNGLGSQEENNDTFVEEEHKRLYLFEGDVIQALYGKEVYGEWSKLRNERDTKLYKWASRLSSSKKRKMLKILIDTNQLTEL